MPPDKTLYDEYLAAKRPRESPEDISAAFIRLANSLVSQHVLDDVNGELTAANIETAAVFDNIGYLQDNGDGTYTLGINYRWWDNASSEGRYAVLIHELTHFEETGHDPSFWDAMARMHTRAKDQYALIETLFDAPFEWDDADWYVVTMADVPNTNESLECVPERRQKMADMIGYDEFDPFKLTAERLSLLEYDDTERVPLSEIAYSVPSDHTLFDRLQSWLSQENAPVTFNTETQTYQCEPPTIGEPASGTGNRPVLVGDERVQLIARSIGRYREDPEIPVRIASDPPS